MVTWADSAVYFGFRCEDDTQNLNITATKNGQAPDAAIVALAGTRSKHNTYMSVPLVFMMISQHATWAASSPVIELTIMVGVAWAMVYHIYGRAAAVSKSDFATYAFAVRALAQAGVKV